MARKDKQKASRPAHRPTIWKDSFCEDVIELGKLGKSKTQMAAALNISKETLYAWMREKPHFSDAVSLAMVHSQDWWENIGQQSLFAEKFQATVYNRQMGNRFRDDHGLNVEQEGAADNARKLITDKVIDSDEWEREYNKT